MHGIKIDNTEIVIDTYICVIGLLDSRLAPEMRLSDFLDWMVLLKRSKNKWTTSKTYITA